jgi:hypothetical protein
LQECIHPAYNGTMVSACLTKGEITTYVLCHFSAEGHLIKHYRLPKLYAPFAMISDYIVLVPDSKKATVLVIDLKQKSIREFPHSFPEGYISQRIFFFCESGFFCLVDASVTETQVTYYNGSFKTIAQKMLKSFHHPAKKLNNYSKITWNEISCGQ